MRDEMTVYEIVCRGVWFAIAIAALAYLGQIARALDLANFNNWGR